MPSTRTPNFENLLAVLRGETPARPVLFEIYLSEGHYQRLAGYSVPDKHSLAHMKMVVDAFAAGGYDYATVQPGNLHFRPEEEMDHETISLNEGFVITDRESLERYVWPDPAGADFSQLAEIESYLPHNMKLMVMSPGGVLENTIALLGYENLCYLLADEPELVELVFNKVGSVLYEYYRQVLRYPAVGLLMVNDDWGFNRQPFLPPNLMRRYVFPWHKKIVEMAHAQGRPAVLHSCGNMQMLWEDIIEEIGFDGKHSYEDNILCVEESYRLYGGRIAILGGIDMDFLVRSSCEEIEKRSRALLEMAAAGGSYALGSGNSIPDYIPAEKFDAMRRVALEH